MHANAVPRQLDISSSATARKLLLGPDYNRVVRYYATDISLARASRCDLNPILNGRRA